MDSATCKDHWEGFMGCSAEALFEMNYTEQGSLLSVKVKVHTTLQKQARSVWEVR